MWPENDEGRPRPESVRSRPRPKILCEAEDKTYETEARVSNVPCNVWGV